MPWLDDARGGERLLSLRDLVVITAVAVGAAIITRFLRPTLRAVLTQLARRAKPGASSNWKARPVTCPNASQRGASFELAFEPSAEVPAVPSVEAIETAVRKRYVESVGFDASRDGLVVDHVEQGDGLFRVKVRTARPLSEAQRNRLTGGGETAEDKGLPK